MTYCYTAAPDICISDTGLIIYTDIDCDQTFTGVQTEPQGLICDLPAQDQLGCPDDISIQWLD